MDRSVVVIRKAKKLRDQLIAEEVFGSDFPELESIEALKLIEFRIKNAIDEHLPELEKLIKNIPIMLDPVFDVMKNLQKLSVDKTCMGKVTKSFNELLQLLTDFPENIAKALKEVHENYDKAKASLAEYTELVNVITLLTRVEGDAPSTSYGSLDTGRSSSSRNKKKGASRTSTSIAGSSLNKKDETEKPANFPSQTQLADMFERINIMNKAFGALEEMEKKIKEEKEKEEEEDKEKEEDEEDQDQDKEEKKKKKKKKTKKKKTGRGR